MFEQMIVEESAKLYMKLLEQAVKDKYRGHRDYHLMIQSIRSDLPIIGGEINVQKEDGNGNFYTETYHVTVLDDLGNPLRGVDDLGGQCRKGEIVKKGFLFTCMKCGKNFFLIVVIESYAVVLDTNNLLTIFILRDDSYFWFFLIFCPAEAPKAKEGFSQKIRKKIN